jgi:hypothetical protein
MKHIGVKAVSRPASGTEATPDLLGVERDFQFVNPVDFV